MDRLDVYVADRPVRSVDVDDDTTTLSIAATAKTPIEIRGFENGEQVARYLMQV
jgi:hypothetical protein